MGVADPTPFHLTSTRRLSIEQHADQTVIRYQWCTTFSRYGLAVFLPLAATILIVEHGGKALTLRLTIELIWAAMVLGLILILALNWNEVRATRDEVRIRCTPVAIVAPRTLSRGAITSVHHWTFWRKHIHYRLGIQTASHVYLGRFDTREEAMAAAQAIAQRLQVQCIEGPPEQKMDWVQLRSILRIAGCLAAPLALLAVLSIGGRLCSCRRGFIGSWREARRAGSRHGKNAAGGQISPGREYG